MILAASFAELLLFLPIALPLCIIALLYALAIPCRLLTWLWEAVHTVRKAIPSNPARWRGVAWMLGVAGAVAWIGGLIFLALLRESQLTPTALAADRQQFFDGVAWCFAAPYRATRAMIAFPLTLSGARKVIYIIGLLFTGLFLVAMRSFYPWAAVQIKRALAWPVLVLGVVWRRDAVGPRCHGAVAAALAPVTLLVVSAVGWLPLPLLALWYLLLVACVSFVTLGVFADDKLAAFWNEPLERQKKAETREWRRERRQIERARARALAQGRTLFDVRSDPRFRFPPRPLKPDGFRQRVRETDLLMLTLLGGWPGAVTGQRLLNHKVGQKKPQTVWLATLLYTMIPIHTVVALTALFLWA